MCVIVLCHITIEHPADSTVGGYTREQTVFTIAVAKFKRCYRKQTEMYLPKLIAEGRLGDISACFGNDAMNVGIMTLLIDRPWPK